MGLGHRMKFVNKLCNFNTELYLIIPSRRKAAEAKIARVLRFRVVTRIDQASMSDRRAPLISTLEK